MLAGETTGPVPEDRDRLTVISIAGGKASGPVVGGCLVDVIYTIGTPWEPDLDGAIFFFEDAGHAPIQIDRALLHLEQIGKLDGVRGVVVGELAGCEWDEFTSAPRSKTLEDVLEDASEGSASPCSTGCRWGTARASPRCRSASEATVDADATDAHDRRACARDLDLARAVAGRDRRACRARTSRTIAFGTPKPPSEPTRDAKTVVSTCPVRVHAGPARVAVPHRAPRGR